MTDEELIAAAGDAELARYKLVGYDHGAEPDKNGGWVRYSDVAGRLAAANARAEEWKLRWQKKADALEVQEQSIAILRARAEAAEARLERERDKMRANCVGCITPAEHAEVVADFEARIASLTEALKGILSNHETVGAGASIFQCTTAQVKAARAALQTEGKAD